MNPLITAMMGRALSIPVRVESMGQSQAKKYRAETRFGSRVCGTLSNEAIIFPINAAPDRLKYTPDRLKYTPDRFEYLTARP
jgi:hypothetical protein